MALNPLILHGGSFVCNSCNISFTIGGGPSERCKCTALQGTSNTASIASLQEVAHTIRQMTEQIQETQKTLQLLVGALQSRSGFSAQQIVLLHNLSRHFDPKRRNKRTNGLKFFTQESQSNVGGKKSEDSQPSTSQDGASSSVSSSSSLSTTTTADLEPPSKKQKL
eukprot:gb/GEZN01018578.1/.p1 GENE.gb/GEZN01018578.1/~~gb/GEZN01018578.1/.p1  ORF type:complete len:173 (-),score=8.69 gb/GEZN01018578.1/:231-728(-)